MKCRERVSARIELRRLRGRVDRQTDRRRGERGKWANVRLGPDSSQSLFLVQSARNNKAGKSRGPGPDGGFVV